MLSTKLRKMRESTSNCTEFVLAIRLSPLTQASPHTRGIDPEILIAQLRCGTIHARGTDLTVEMWTSLYSINWQFDHDIEKHG